MKYYLFLVLNFLILNAYAQNEGCNRKNWKISSLELSVADPYTATTLGFSYGPEVKKYISKMSGAISRFYYEGDQLNSKLTYVSTYFANESDAKEAYNHLKQRFGKSEFHEVAIKGKQVIWFGANKVDKKCLQEVRAEELRKL